MRLPHHEQAILDLRKIEDYCLDPNHPRGRHKARVFRHVLGVDRGHAEWLRQSILTGLRDGEAAEMANDENGRRWRVDITAERHGRRCVIRTIWIVRLGEQIPRFVTCWVP